MIALVTLFTPTRNKPEHLRECYAALQAQTNQQWEWLIALNEPDARTRAAVIEFTRDDRVRYVTVNPKTLVNAYPPAVAMNTFLPTILTKYMMFMADDDLLEPDALDSLINLLESNQDWDVVHGLCEVWVECESEFKKSPLAIKFGAYWWEPSGWIGGDLNYGKGTGIEPDCVLDGGQILQTRRSYEKMCEGGWQLTTELTHCGHCDGIYMARLAEFYTFHSIGKKVLTHRKTALSTMSKPDWGWLE